MTDFHHWLRKNLSRTPSQETDDRILKLARAKLKSRAPERTWFAFGSGGLVAAGLLVFLMRPGVPPLVPELAVSKDMLLYQDELEVGVETAELSDDEWTSLIGDKS